jgi:predicted nucleic acid-binding protein
VITAYFDSSAILKLSKEEAETQALIDFLHEGPVEASTSVLSDVEVQRNVRRHRLDYDRPLAGFYLLALDDEVRQIAIDIGAATLRSVDAIHLATALAIGDRELQFVTYDDRQAEAARAAGLKVIQPGRG